MIRIISDVKNCLKAVFFILAISSPALAQHMTPPHDHSTNGKGVCWGYAMGRAWGKPEGDVGCNPGTIIPQGASTEDPLSWANWNINATYWEYQAGKALTGIAAGNIVYWSGHAAYVVAGASGDQTIYIREISRAGETPRDVSLSRQPDGGSYRYQHPDRSDAAGYYHWWDYPVTAKNEFIHNGDLDDGGSMSIGGESDFSPMTREKRGSTTLYTTNRQQFPSNYWQVYRRWRKPDGNPDQSNPLSIAVLPSNNLYTAEFDKELNITFQNSFIGVGNGGNIKVRGEPRSSPYVDHTNEVKNVGFQSTDAEAVIYQVINGIEYTFTQWHDNSTSANRTFNPVNESQL